MTSFAKQVECGMWVTPDPPPPKGHLSTTKQSIFAATLAWNSDSKTCFVLHCREDEWSAMHR